MLADSQWVLLPFMQRRARQTELKHARTQPMLAQQPLPYTLTRRRVTTSSERASNEPCLSQQHSSLSKPPLMQQFWFLLCLAGFWDKRQRLSWSVFQIFLCHEIRPLPSGISKSLWLLFVHASPWPSDPARILRLYYAQPLSCRCLGFWC